MLNSSGYSKIPLVVSDSMFRDQREVCDLMNDYEVDFKRGRVNGDPTICFVRDYGREFEPTNGEAWRDLIARDYPIPEQLLSTI